MWDVVKRWWQHRQLREQVDEFARLAAEAIHPTQPRAGATRRLGRFGVVAVPPLRLALTSHSAEVRAAAAQALREVGAKATEAVGDLLTCLRDADAEVRRRCAQALAAIAPRQLDVARAVVPILLDGLRSRDGSARARALLALLDLAAEPEPLWRAGELHPPLVRELALALEDPDEEVCRRAAWCIGKLGLDASAAVEALIRGMTHRSVRVLEEAAEAACTISQQRVAALELARRLVHAEATERHAARAQLSCGSPIVAKWAIRLTLSEATEDQRAALGELDFTLLVVEEGIRTVEGPLPASVVDILRAANKVHLIPTALSRASAP